MLLKAFVLPNNLLSSEEFDCSSQARRYFGANAFPAHTSLPVRRLLKCSWIPCMNDWVTILWSSSFWLERSNWYLCLGSHSLFLHPSLSLELMILRQRKQSERHLSKSWRHRSISLSCLWHLLYVQFQSHRDSAIDWTGQSTSFGAAFENQLTTNSLHAFARLLLFSVWFARLKCISFEFVE